MAIYGRVCLRFFLGRFSLMFVIRHKGSGKYVSPVGSRMQYVGAISSARTFFSEAQAAGECCGVEEVVPHPTKRTRPHVITAQHVVDYFRESGQRDVCLMVEHALTEIKKR